MSYASVPIMIIQKQKNNKLKIKNKIKSTEQSSKSIIKIIINNYFSFIR